MGNNDTKPPSKTEMAKNFSKSMVEWGKGGFKKTPKEIYDERMKICRGCKFWKEIKGPLIGQCLKCGCTGMKQKIATSKCPIDKWGAI